MIPTSPCLQRVEEGDRVCPFKMLNTEFGEGLEFDRARTTHFVINAFGLESIGRTRPTNISASMDAAKVTKNLLHTPAGFKMSDLEGSDPLKSMRSFLADEHSLHDLQSWNTVFLMKIVLTKETKETFRLFDDLFQFFCLAGCNNQDLLNDPKNLEKFDWRQLEDLEPLNITTTTDMAADWKLVGVGGGMKQTKMFCTLCPLHSDNVHQPNPKLCDRFLS